MPSHIGALRFGVSSGIGVSLRTDVCLGIGEWLGGIPFGDVRTNIIRGGLGPPRFPIHVLLSKDMTESLRMLEHLHQVHLA